MFFLSLILYERLYLCQNLISHPTEHDWSSFDKYAAKVRVLSIDRHQRFNFTPDLVSSTICDKISRRTSILFPNLQVLNYEVGDRPVKFLFLLTSPSLYDVSLSILKPTRKIGAVVTEYLITLPQKSSRVRYLTLEGPFKPRQFFLDHITFYNNLRYLDVSLLSKSNLVHVLRQASTLTNLVSLSVDVNGDRETDIPKFNGFSALEELNIVGPFCRIEKFLSALPRRDRGLKSLTVTSDIWRARSYYQNDDTWSSFFLVVVTHVGTSVENLSFCETPYSNPHSCKNPYIIFDRSFFDPLLQINQLRTLSFKGFPAVSLLDEDVALLAQAWPKLEILLLPDSINAPVQPSLFGLQHFSSHCPNLDTLAMTIWTRDIPDIFNIHHKLRTLILKRSWISKPLEVAFHFSHAFPRLESVEHATFDWRTTFEVAL